MSLDHVNIALMMAGGACELCLKTKILFKYSSLLSNGKILSYTYIHTYILFSQIFNKIE